MCRQSTGPVIPCRYIKIYLIHKTNRSGSVQTVDFLLTTVVTDGKGINRDIGYPIEIGYYQPAVPVVGTCLYTPGVAFHIVSSPRNREIKFLKTSLVRYEEVGVDLISSQL